MQTLNRAINYIRFSIQLVRSLYSIQILTQVYFDPNCYTLILVQRNEERRKQDLVKPVVDYTKNNH